MEEVLEQTAQIISCRSLLGVLKVPLASELTNLLDRDIIQQKLILPDYDKMLDNIRQNPKPKCRILSDKS